MIYLILGVDNMLVLAKAMLALMIGFILSILCGLILIPYLKRKKQGRVLVYF